ncbi:MAG: TRAP transporter small permease [Proteobacteria bacterium]|nr:TRAP transporter small permease [Pseudomonadota bacterium]
MTIHAVPHKRLPLWKWVLDQFEEIVACVALASVILSVSWGVITRYITEQPATWASEVATLSFAWVVFFGATACVKYKLHPSIDMLVVRLPLPLQWCVRWLNHALVLGFCVFMAWFGTRFAIDAWSNPSPVLRLPLTWLYGPVAFCFGLMAVRYIQVLTRGAWLIEADRETYVG